MELLVRIIDKEQPDETKRELVSKRGDVIAVCPDGHPWTETERTVDFWRIIRTPILMTHAETMLDQKIQLNGKLKRRREYSIDFSKLPNPELYDGKRTVDIIDVSRADLVKASKRKP